MKLEVEAGWITQQLQTLARFSETPAPAITRIVFTPPDLHARHWLKQLCREACLAIREDAVGNTFARWTGSEPHGPVVATGSHMDAIPNSGQYDGTIGVLGGLAAIRTLQASGFQPQRSIELILFTSEEPTRFGIGCLGSRLLSGTLSPVAAASLKDKDGGRLDEATRSAGFRNAWEDIPLSPGAYYAFVELHIEQGPLLEQAGLSIGVVTNIAAPASLRVTVQGQGGHAGAVLMADRRDALLGAAEIALAVDAVARSTGAMDSVATTGVCDVFPGAVNSIPSLVRLEVDVRDTDLARRDRMVQSITTASRNLASKHGLELTIEVLNADAPAPCHPMVIEAITRACETTATSWTPLVSRAYHDSLFMSRLAPTGMIFIPCRAGVSHRPDEYASPEHIASGALVLAETLRQLSA